MVVRARQCFEGRVAADQASSAMNDPVSIDPAARKLSPDDAVLDVLWRETFGQPLPILGAAAIVREILKERGVVVPRALSQKTGGNRNDAI